MPLMEGGAEASAAPGAEPEQFSDLVLLPPAHVDLATWANATDIWPHYCTIPDLATFSVYTRIVFLFVKIYFV